MTQETRSHLINAAGLSQNVPQGLKPAPLLDICGTAKQLAEKVLRRRNCREGVLQGLKPDADLIGFIGPSKVVPLLQGL